MFISKTLLSMGTIKRRYLFPVQTCNIYRCGNIYFLCLVTVCNTLPFLSIMRNSSFSELTVTIEKPGSELQKTVPSIDYFTRQ